ncbi:MAG TPA: transglycosylase SLT domain-containing protein [Iamia sp.]|nr:transglycosylase SLT domain-containing protein [Iamia sp.]
MKRFALSLAVVVGLVVGLSACDEQTTVQMAIQQSFPEEGTHAKAVRVADCESDLNPRAVSAGGKNHGLFQINSVHKPTVERMGYKWDQIYDPYVNAKVARKIFNDAGSSWAPWGCRNA